MQRSILPQAEEFLASWAGRAALVSHLAVLAVAFSLFAFSKPIADDFCRANMADGFFVYLQQDYVNWSGRWLAHGLEVVLLSSWDPTVSYPALAGAIALLHLLSIYVFVRTLIAGEVKRATILGFTVSYFVLFWSMHPAPGQSFYWFTGSVEYQLNFSLTLLLLALLSHRPAATASWQRFLQSAVAPALGFLIAGIHELFGCMVAVVLFVGAVVTRKTGHVNRRLWAWVAVFSLLGLLLVASAPGNQARRMASFPDSYNLLLTLWLTPWQAVKAVTRWICDVKLLSATVLFILHPAIRLSRPDWLLHGRMSLRWVILGTWVLLLAIGFGAPSWITGQEMSGRTLSAVYYVFLLGWFVNVFVFTQTLDLGSIVAKERLPSIRSFTLVLYSLSVVTTGNSRVAMHDLVHRAVPWHEAIEERYGMIRGSERNGVLDAGLPALPDRPRIFGREPSDITSDPTHWSNVCFADFFGLPSVRLETSN